MTSPGPAPIVTHNHDGGCPVVVAVPGQPIHVFGYAQVLTDPSEATAFLRQECVQPPTDAGRGEMHIYVLTVRYGGMRDEVDATVAAATSWLYESLDTDGRHDLTVTATAPGGEVLGHLVYEASFAWEGGSGGGRLPATADQ